MRISICIPQYNRCAHLIKALESIRLQRHPDVEVVVSDDCSTDDSREKIPAYLAQSGLQHRYIQQSANIGYDANLRAALGAGTGDYLFVLGNDDELPSPDTLTMVDGLLSEEKPDLAIGNIIDAHSGQVVKRVTETRGRPGSPELAIKMFRALSCVTGLIFSRQAFARHDTSRFDGSVFVQMYLGSRILASAGKLLTIEPAIACTGTSVGTGRANSYRDKLKEFTRTIRPITGGLDNVGQVVCDAIGEYVEPSKRRRMTTAVFAQLLMYSYSYWLFDYRSHGGQWAAFNLALGCFPPRLLAKVDRTLLTSASLFPYYVAATSSTLVPVSLMSNLKEYVREYALRRRAGD
jgi:glycosyltransferase involved in cell wall biosynthesis